MPASNDTAEIIAVRIAAILEKSRDDLLARVAAIECAAAGLAVGCLSDDERHHAEREAHKLAGVAGTFGFPAASVLAKEAELLLRPDRDISNTVVARLAEIGAELRGELTPG